MGSCCVKQQLTDEDIKFLKKHTRYDEETIRTETHTKTLNISILFLIFSLRISKKEGTTNEKNKNDMINSK